MSRLIIPFLFLILVTFTSTAVGTTALPRHDESALLQRVTFEPIAEESRIWDFSMSEYSGDPIEVRFDWTSDSCMSAWLPGIRYDYELRGDTIFHVATETHFMRLSDTIPMQSNVYRTFYQEEYSDNIFDGECPEDTIYSTLHCRTWLLSERIRLDSTSVTNKYPDGSERAVWQRHYYNRLLSSRDTRFYEDPDSLFPSPVDSLFFPKESLLPVTTITGCGNDYVIHNTIRACNVKGAISSFERQRCVELSERNFGNTPVTDRWIAKRGSATDSLIMERQYGYYGQSPYIFPKRHILRREPTAVIAEQKFHDYNSRGQVLSMTETDGSVRSYEWDETSNFLLSKTIAGLTSTFTHIPMVGCTSVTSPSGKKHTFTYNAGRLTSEKNGDGKTVAAYSYKLYADGGKNMIESSVYNDLGAAKTQTYYDGFGMPVQTVAIGAGSDASQDICSYTVYDGIDRPVRQWLPLPVSGIDDIQAFSDLQSFATSVYGNDARPYSETNYAASPGERVCAVYSPGEALAAHPATTEYLCNSSTVPELRVRKFTYSPSTSKIGVAGYYPAGQFDAVKAVDADGHTVITFMDWRGYKVHERRVLTDGDFIDTHYIYDVWGNPIIVLQPEICAYYATTSGSFSLDSDRAKKYTFQYAYDRCGRLVSKKIPGREPETYRYDPYGRLAFMQDGNMRSRGQAVFTLYDDASRIVLTGICGDYAMAESVSIPVMTATRNIRGALKTITNNLQFMQTLYYEDGDNPLYSGRISAISDNIGRRKFSYDGVGRLISSVNVQTNFITFPYNNEVFSTSYTYDRNSNIKSLDRRGYINDSKKAEADYVDNLVFSYSGNQLISVTDNAADALDSSSYDFQDGTNFTPEYSYDRNGNITSDSNRGVAEVRYNSINLPALIAFNNVRWLEYGYRADGVKLSSKLLMGNLPDEEITIKSLIPGETVLAAGDDAAVTPLLTRPSIRKVMESKTYLGNYEFLGDSLLRLNTPYGFFYKDRFYVNAYDYQGNLVASGGEAAAGVAQENHYYPYGLPVRNGGNDSYTPYLFGGKEFESRQGLNLYDFLARTYSPDEARFWQPDPKADDYHWLSPYVYCGGDPINFIDPDGMTLFYVDMFGRIISTEERMIKNSEMNETDAALDSYDQVIIIGKDGQPIYSSPKYKVGTIELVAEENKFKDLDITLFRINNSDVGKAIFEKLSKWITANNGVEFGFISQKRKGGTHSFVFSAHKVRKIEGMFQVFSYAFVKYRKAVIDIIHSHDDDPNPSPADTDSQDQINKYIDDVNDLNKKKFKHPNYQIYISRVSPKPLYIRY